VKNAGVLVVFSTRDESPSAGLLGFVAPTPMKSS
jgi:hypothetical protein